MTKSGVDERLGKAVSELPIVTIVRELGDPLRALDVVSALRDGGATAIEVTTNTVAWQAVVTRAGELGFGAVGVGTVLTMSHVLDAHDCGASFVVSPGFDEAIVKEALARGMDVLPGAMTPTEICSALGAGAQRVKLFPAGTLGLAYFGALRAPFDGVEFVPTGGISPQNAVSWLRAGSWALGMGGSLTSGTPQEIELRMRDLRDSVLAERKDTL
jgi:Entner-Doudoroff aldolase